MRTQRLSTGIAIVLFATATAAAQDSVAKNPPPIYEPPVPAHSILALRDELHLSNAQIAKLKTLETTQIGSLNGATAAFLRAEADLLDAGRHDDIGVRRHALEKRANIAIDAEVGRLQAEKDSRAVLTADQRAKLDTISDSQGRGGVLTEVAVWQSVVAPPPLTRVVRSAPPPDSAEVRIAVMPTYADIYLDGIKIGSGRRLVTLAIGVHTLLYHAAGCKDITVPITVEKGPPLVVPRQTLTCSGVSSGEY